MPLFGILFLSIDPVCGCTRQGLSRAPAAGKHDLGENTGYKKNKITIYQGRINLPVDTLLFLSPPYPTTE